MLDKRQWRTVIPKRKEINEVGPRIVPTHDSEAFLTTIQAEGTKTEPHGLTELRRQRLEKGGSVGKNSWAEYQRRGS